MDGWQTLGAVLGSGPGRREDAFRSRMGENLTLGARDHALRQSVMKTEGLQGLGDALVQMGFDPAVASGMAQMGRAGLDPEQYTGAQGDLQAQGFRSAAVEAAARGDWGGGNAQMLGVATGPVDVTKIADGTAYNRLVAPGIGDMLTTDVGQSTIRQRDASAGASRASAASSYATARNADVRSQIARGQYDLSVRGQWNPDGASASGAAGSGDQALPKLTEGQSKDLVYLTRGQKANDLLQSQDRNMTPTGGAQGPLRSLGDTIVRHLPWVGDSTAANLAVSPERQVAEQSGREFLSAVLRKDTGAAITREEIDVYGKTYLPQPGDSDAVLKQKSSARQIALDAIRTGLGPVADPYNAPRPASVGDALSSPPATTAFPRATNSATGQTLELRNGQWMPVR